MKRNFFFIITLLISITANSQANYYYYDGNKIDLDMNINYVNVLSDTDFDYNSIPDIQVDTLVTNKTYMWYKIHFININDKVEFYSKRNQLLNNNHIKHIAYYYGNLNDEPVGTSNIFYVKLKNIQDINELENLCGQNNVELVKQVPYMPFWFKLKSKTFITSIELANLFYQYDIIDEIDVGFDIKYTIPILSSSSNTQTTPNTSNSSNCVNDTDFNLQWGLENLINPDIDINACDAWNISKGNNVKVAIVDTGIDTTNSDLVNTEINFYNSFFDQVLTQPYTTYGHHGTMMAGTIGAIQNNSYKISGVAPECLMMDVMFSDQPGQNAFPNRGEALAACISYAWQNEADVINCSWGDRAGHLQDIHSPLLIQALNNAATQGRNGRGCVVVFASGNQYQNINYPPINFNKALCVGGIDINGERAIWGGGFLNHHLGID